MASALSTAGATAQGIDREYTEKIREFTTEPFFSTPYVDYLPASETVPTPLDVLGHIAGAADILSYPEEVYRYLRAVAAASPRVEVFTIGETEEGREMILVVVADEETIANLDQHKAMLAALSDPRVTDQAEADRLIATAKPIYWSTGAIHSPETGSPEMFMEVVYRLAVDESPFIRSIRDNVIFMTTPIVEVDGRAKVVDLHMGKRKDTTAVLPSRPLYWGKYVAHDNNRDGIGLSLALSRVINETYHEYHPTILHDHHESASHLYTSTGRGPYNAWFDPIVINEWNNIAYQEVKEMTALGVPGVYTHDFYDGWAPNYMFSAAHMHNSIGRFYETQGAGDGSTRIIRSTVEREWHRPNTPLSEVTWSIRNNVNLQQSALLIALNYVGDNRQEFLRNFYRKGQRSIAKASAEGPAAYVFPADERRPELQARLLNLVRMHGVEIHRATRSFTVDEREFAEGAFVIRMDQPYSRGADMLLDKQYYNPNDPRPYDDVGWTLGPLFDVETVRVEDPEVLSASMELVAGDIGLNGGVENTRNAVAFLIDYNADNSLTSFRFANPDLRIDAAQRDFRSGNRDYRAGTFIVHAPDAPVAARLEAAAREFGFIARGVSRVPDVPTHHIDIPRIAIAHTWTNTQSEGWLRIGFDEYGVPYDYISVHELRDEPNLRSRYDVIVMGPTSLNALPVLSGVTGDEPIPWRRSELTPNLGYNDQTDDMRGGLELSGVGNLQRFVEDGGVFVTLTSSASIPIHFGMVSGVRIQDTPNLWARGGVFRTSIREATSPIVYGFDEELGVYFNSAPVFAVGGGGGFGGFGGGGDPEDLGDEGSTTTRRTGRGGMNEQDIVQGRPRDLGQAGVEAFRSEHEEDVQGSPVGGDSGSRARTIASFARNASDVLISGGIRNPQDLANTPALIDAPVGEGHVVMFGFNPFWRGETLGSYALMFNTLMHWNNLDAQAAVEAEIAATSGGGAR
jgi:hypothetical protein